MSVEDLEFLYGYCINTLEQNDRKLEKAQEKQADLKEELEGVRNQFAYLDEAETLYKKAIDILYERSFSNLETKINAFLSKVFDDCQYKVFFTPETLRGSKVVNIELQSGDIISIPSDFGGSFETVIGLAFRIIYILQTGYPVLFLDETLRDINDTYLYKLLDFLKSLGQEFGIEFAIITHNEKISHLADAHYIVHNKTYNRIL